MFNLTVDQAHTFYVGQNGWLVHNQSRKSPVVYGPYELSGKPDPVTGIKSGGLPKPANGMSMGELGKLIGWGGKVTTGYDDAIKRIETLTDADIEKIFNSGVGSDYAKTLADGYRNAPQPNPTAPGRAKLMDAIAERLAKLEGGCR